MGKQCVLEGNRNESFSSTDFINIVSRSGND